MNGSAKPKIRLLPIVLMGMGCLSCMSPSFAGICDGVPNCQEQEMAPVRYKALETRGWAYYCTGDHPYYWNNAPAGLLGFGSNWSRSPHCFSMAENPFAESQSASKADFTITNWCADPFFKAEDITVKLGCSQLPQGSGQSCSGNLEETSDPKCPVSGSVRNNCSRGPVSVCIQTYTEKCPDGKEYYCTADEGIIFCLTCPD